MANTQRASVWSLTINNPSSDDEESIALARQKGWRVEGQKEVGENGTTHYQLMLRTPQVRFSAIKKQFPRAHIEVARNSVALENYVHKEETRVGQLPTSQDKYPSLSKFWHLMFELYNSGDKEGLNFISLSDGVCEFYSPDKDKIEPLLHFDSSVGELIRRGYYVESIAYNPSVRSQWKHQWRNILLRCFVEKENDAIETQQNANDQLPQEDHTSGNTETSSSESI